MRLQPLPLRSSRRGALGTGLIVLIVILVLVFGVGACGVGKYNGLAASKAKVEAGWAEIDNQYKRRYELVPNLVETVKGAANFEKSTLEEVTRARAEVGKMQLPSGVPTDEKQLAAWTQAQQGLSGALSRLMVVSEQYPQLKSSQNFLALQDQLEGTENRIATARRDYIEAVKGYETSRTTFPGNLLAGLFHFEKIPQLTMPEAERSVPKVDFGSSAK